MSVNNVDLRFFANFELLGKPIQTLLQMALRNVVINFYHHTFLRMLPTTLRSLQLPLHHSLWNGYMPHVTNATLSNSLSSDRTSSSSGSNPTSPVSDVLPINVRSCM